MSAHPFAPARRRRLAGLVGVPLVGLVVAGVVVSLAGAAQAAPTNVPLGTAESFVVLAGAGITNTGPTQLNGDVGTYPTTTITGSDLWTVTGVEHAGDGVTQNAKTDLVGAYNTAAGEGPTTPVSGDLGGRTLTPGVYNSASSMGLTGTLILDAAGDPDAAFVFQTGSTLTTSSASRISLVNGAQACHIYWQVGTSATLGVGSTFRGTIMAMTSVTATTGARIQGRLLARNGAVTLDTNVVTRPSCAAAPTPSASPSSSATSSAASSAGPTSSTTPGAQVSDAPSGGIGTGDGSTEPLPSSSREQIAGGLALAALGLIAVAAERRRRRSS